MRVLLLGDTHLGFDAPRRPRVHRRRRGPDFLRSFEEALEPALSGQVDLVVHGGDLLFRARVPPALVQEALAPLLRVAERSVPVFLVPGNHERSRIPYPLLAQHEHLHIFHRPCTFTVRRNGVIVAVSGFPFARRVGGAAFGELLERTQWRRHDADVRLLCVHQTVEGARVGVQNFTFRPGPDVIAGRDVPADFAAVLSGHIHRWQALTVDLQGRSLAAPVLYPGSVERTSFAERDEEKGYLLLRIDPGPGGGRLAGCTFVPLTTRPMAVIELDVEGLGHDALRARLRRSLEACRPESVVRVDVRGAPLPEAHGALGAGSVRAAAPPDFNVTVSWREQQHRA